MATFLEKRFPRITGTSEMASLSSFRPQINPLVARRGWITPFLLYCVPKTPCVEENGRHRSVRGVTMVARIEKGALDCFQCL
jgi:hypothetical protein